MPPVACYFKAAVNYYDKINIKFILEKKYDNKQI